MNKNQSHAELPDFRVFAAAMKINGDDFDAARSWYRGEPLAAFGGKTPATLVDEDRADDLLRYIESLEAGAAG